MKRTVLLTKKEADAILLAAGNSTSDPDWWESYGVGQLAAYYRAEAKILKQARLRDDGAKPKRRGK